MPTFTYSPAIANMLETRALNNADLHAFSEEATRLIQSDPSCGFRACAPLLEDLCRSDAFSDLVNYELDRLLFGHTCDMILVPVSRSGITLSRYHQPKPHPNDILDKSRHLTFKGDVTLAFGQSSFFAACEDIFLINSTPHEANPPMLAILITPDKFQIRWEYDSTTLAPVRAIAADNSASRLEFVISLMSTMNDRAALPVLRELSSSHPAHFVRWAAVQAMFRLDRDTGMQALHCALNDPHEHVRNAASRSIAKIVSSLQSKLTLVGESDTLKGSIQRCGKDTNR
jgi:HEAT repeats